MYSTDDQLTRLSSLFERLGAVVWELDHCKIMMPDNTEQLDLDIAATYAMMRRIEQWANTIR